LTSSPKVNIRGCVPGIPGGVDAIKADVRHATKLSNFIAQLCCVSDIGKVISVVVTLSINQSILNFTP